ncbi:unnamed protein product, partial [Aureobasidium uvarum]
KHQTLPMSKQLFRPLFSATKSHRCPSGINAGEGGAKPSQMLTHTDPRADHKKLLKEAKKDPELYVPATFALAGWFGGHQLARYKIADRDERETTKLAHTEPWKEGAEGSAGKYRYTDSRSGYVKIKDAPKALNSVIVPGVNLPKRFNKWGKEEFDEY